MFLNVFLFETIKVRENRKKTRRNKKNGKKCKKNIFTEDHANGTKSATITQHNKVTTPDNVSLHS